MPLQKETKKSENNKTQKDSTNRTNKQAKAMPEFAKR